MDNIQIIQLPPERWKEYRDIRLEMLLKDPQAFGQRYEKSLNDSDSKWKERLEASQKQDKIIILFAENNGKLVGTIGAFFNSTEDTQDSAQIFSVYVNEDYRGLGIAKRLQDQLLSQLKNLDLVKVRVMVNKTQIAAVNLYTQGGFKLLKTEKRVLGDGKEYEVDTLEQALH